MTTLHAHIRFAKKLVNLLDTKFNVFGLRFGIDPLLDAIPGIGDVMGAITSCYLYWIAYKLNVPRIIYAKMAWNILFDFVLGLIPVIGIVFDSFYKSNVKNFALVEKYFDPNILEGVFVEV